MKDELRTGPDARLQVTFRDNTVLTLGENARLIVDRYVYEPERGIGEAALKASAGAFLFATSLMKSLKDKNILVSTPLAEIGVRGTEFWGGPIDGQYGVFLIEGEITVRAKAEALPSREEDKRPASPRRSIRQAPPRHGRPKRFRAPSRPCRCIRAASSGRSLLARPLRRNFTPAGPASLKFPCLAGIPYAD